MRQTVKLAMLASSIFAAANGQTSGKAEFEVASVKANAPQQGFHFATEAVSGGPGAPNADTFRCSKCSLATLIVKAFKLQPYQFPGRKPLTDSTYEVTAKIPIGATEEEFSAMLQNLLKDRFGLTWHFEDKVMKGYHLVVAKGGSQLKESANAPFHGGQAEPHNHSGVLAFGTSATYRAANQTTADLARILSDQLDLPVADGTGLAGRYDISLRWSGVAASGAGNHSDGPSYGGAGHAGHDGIGAPSGTPSDPAGPSLFDALQQQLGLKLVRAEQASARLFIVDRVSRRPTEN